MMFVVGICVGKSDRFERIAEPSLRRWMGADARLIALRNQESIFAAYNRILDEAALLADLEGVILIHDDVEITGDVCAELRKVLVDASIGVVGVVGGAGRAAGMAWFSREHHLGDLDGRGFRDPESHWWGDVDVVDGYFMAVSAGVASTTRFDLEDCAGFHRYDAELCSLVQADGGRIVVHPLPVRHVHSGLYRSKSSSVSWARSNLEWRAKWGDLNVAERLINRARIRLMPLELRVRPASRRRLRTLE